MIPVTSAVLRGFTFHGISRGYEVRRNGESVGTLQRPSIWSASYIATTPDGSWKFRRGGFFNTGAEIVDATSQQTIATFKCPWGGKGELTFYDGQRFLVTSRGCWHPVWSVTTEDGRPVLELHTRDRDLAVQSEAIPAARLSMLALFALYRMRQAQEDAAAVVVAAT